jgi:tRNA(Ile)-lysidine synthase
VPALRALDPRAERNILRTAELLREEAAVLDEVVAGVLRDGADGIALARLAALRPALARLVVRRLAEDAVGAGGARAAGRLADILALGDRGALDVGAGARAVVTRGVLRFERTPPRPGRT